MSAWRPAPSKLPPTSPDQTLPGCRATARPLPGHWQATSRARHAFWPPCKRPLAGHCQGPPRILAALQAFWLPGKRSGSPASILAAWQAARHAFWLPGIQAFWLPGIQALWLPRKHSCYLASIVVARHAFWVPGTLVASIHKHCGCTPRILAARHIFWLSGRHPVCLARNVAALHAFCL